MKILASVLAASVIVLFFNSPFSYSAERIDIIDKTVVSLVGQIKNQGAIEGLYLQCSPDNFFSRTDLSRPPISRMLYDSVVAELSKNHVDVSLHERGTYPLKVFGFLEIYDEVVSISLVVRRMEERGSHNLAMAQTSIPRAAVPPALLAVSVSDLAGQLIRKMEMQFSNSFGLPVRVSAPMPAEPGLPTLEFGRILQDELVITILDSEVFGGTEVTGSMGNSLALSTSYEVGDEIVVRTALTNNQNRVVARAVVRAPRQGFPEYFWELAPLAAQEVCVNIEVDGARDASQYVERSLVSALTGVIDKAGGILVPCSQGSQETRIDVSLAVREKVMHEGYGILFGDLLVTIGKNRELRGQIDSTGTYPFTDDVKGGMTSLVRVLVDESVKNYINTKLLSTSGTSR